MSEEYREWARNEIAEARAGRVYGTSVTHEAMMAMYDVEQAMRRLLISPAWAVSSTDQQEVEDA